MRDSPTHDRAGHDPTPRFDHVLSGPAASEPRVRSLAQLVFEERPGEDDRAPVVLGCLGQRAFDVSLGQVRHAAVCLARAMAARGIGPGDTVCLARLPHTSEAVCALAYAALSVAGLRLLVPMYLEVDRLGDWLRAAGAKAVLWGAREVEDAPCEADQALLASLRAQVKASGAAEICLLDELCVPALAGAAGLSLPTGDVAARALAGRAALDDECLVLTTSGTSGLSKQVRYSQGALLRSCAAWEAAGLFDHDRLGGRGFTLLLAHSMGIRSLWNALWTRQPVCLVTPEWFVERPELVRAQVVRMRPEHVTGGPAAFRVLLELVRVFPELRGEGLDRLRCAVSTGAPFDSELARRVRAELGIELHNALGLTETMQVTSTVVAAPDRPGALGSPLPGVRLGLAREPGFDDATFRLFVSTPFGSSGYVGEGDAAAPSSRWIDTGDAVSLRGSDLIHAGRCEVDFGKDAFGAKIPLTRVAGWYANLGDPVDHVAFAPLRDEPGLAALVFVDAADMGPGTVADRRTLDRVRSLLESRHERLQHELDDMERRHFTVARFACVRDPPPRTSKGTVNGAAVRALHGPLLDRLCGPPVQEPSLVLLDRESFGRTSYVRLTSPRRGELMRLARLDRTYVRGRGDRLISREGGRDTEVLDLVGGFGTNLLGHRHPDVVAAAAEFLDGEGLFLSDQGSARAHEGELARRLALLVSGVTGAHYVVRFASTGAEAVEMALAHAALEWEERWRRFRRELVLEHGGRDARAVADVVAENEALLRATPPRVVAVSGAFHGKTLGARALLSSVRSRAPFTPLLRLETTFVAPDGSDDVEALLRESAVPLLTLRWHAGRLITESVAFPTIVAAVAEPIQGEGGAHVVAPELLRRLSGRPFPLILDEIQSGLGRSGELLASAGIHGDYYLLGKALGGGVAKIAALLVDRTRYQPRFDELHSSTFAGDAYSCAVAGRVLDVIERDDVPHRAHERGGVLRAALEEVRSEYPDVVRKIRGRGLLLGIELDPAAAGDGFLLRALVDHDLLGVLAAAYLLNVHRLRLLPTLSAPRVLRVEPSAYLGDDDIAQLASGLRALCRTIRDRDAAGLLSFLVDDTRDVHDGLCVDAGRPTMPCRVARPRASATRVAFLSHFVYPERELAMTEPSLARLPATARRALFQRLVAALELRPLVAFSQDLLGGRVHFTNVVVPGDVATFQELHRRGDRRLVTERIQEAVDLAARTGCGAVVLGGYTSILTRDGTALLPPPDVRVSSGNTFTVVVGARRLLRACASVGIDPAAPSTVLALVGATGNIGRGLVHRLAVQGPFARVLLVGRRPEALAALAAVLRAARPDIDVGTSTELPVAGAANVIVVATNTNEPVVLQQHVATNRPTIIVDVSVPSAVAPDVCASPMVTVAPLSGTVIVPGEPSFVISSHTRPGTAFACAAEAMLLGLEPRATARCALVGDVDPDAVALLERIGDQHGFLELLEEGGFRPAPVAAHRRVVTA